MNSRINPILLGIFVVFTLPIIFTTLGIEAVYAIILFTLVTTSIAQLYFKRFKERNTKKGIKEVGLYILYTLIFIITISLSFSASLYILVRSPFIDYIKENYYALLNILSLVSIVWILVSIYGSIKERLISPTTSHTPRTITK